MKTVSYGGLNARLLGGTDGNGGGDGPLVVLCHGFGAPGDDLVSIGRALLEVPELKGANSTRFLFPHALVDLGREFAGGRAWWPIDMMALQRAMMSGSFRDLAGSVPDGLAEARSALNDLLDTAEKELGVSSDRIVLGGFSQGAMLSCDVALRGDRKLAGLVVLSGTVIAESEWTPLFTKLRGLPVFMSHGTSDPTLPFKQAERLRDLFVGGGAAVRWSAFRGGHGIPEETLVGLATFLRDVLP